MTPNKPTSTLMAAAAISAASLSANKDSSMAEDFENKLMLDGMIGLAMDQVASAGFFKPLPLRPDQINWPRNQRKNRKNKRRLLAAGGRVDFKR